MVVPGLAPKPFHFERLEGTLVSTIFSLREFFNIINDLPDLKALAARLAQMHHESQSPPGKFGFHMTLYDGKLPQNTDWESSWTTFFSKLLASTAGLNVEVNGP